jgi:prolyl-tRNA synthetase
MRESRRVSILEAVKMGKKKGLTPRSEDFSAWYNEAVQKAELADHSPVRGCMVIRPWGYRIWELMQSALDAMLKETGVENAYFPLLIPQSFIEREKEHLEGFAPETAVVTHAGGKELDEPLVVRPTSETIIYSMFAKWVQSYRDLPLLINQWANVVRWEMRTRLFLRTSEFLWQEGHTAHATEAEAEERTLLILGVYRKFMADYLALPVLTGLKSPAETFAGALRTYSCEGLMGDNWALQAGTSHNLGQNFARQFDLQYLAESGELEYAWNTSWGVSTRLIGGLVMAHGDDSGMVCPPMLAPRQVVIVPIWRSDEDRVKVMEVSHAIAKDIGGTLRVHVDDRENVKPGAKYFEWEAKGVPLRLEVGPRDVDDAQAMTVRRDRREKEPVPLSALAEDLPRRLAGIQAEMLEAATERREANSHRDVATYEQFREIYDGPGGFTYAGWCESAACEEKVKADTKVTIRVIPNEEFLNGMKPDRCIVCGEPATVVAAWARAY